MSNYYRSKHEGRFADVKAPNYEPTESDKRKEKLAMIMRGLSAAAPVVGAVGGGIAGGAFSAGNPAAIAAGAGVGGSVGSGIGGLGMLGADELESDRERKELEAQERRRALTSLLGRY